MAKMREKVPAAHAGTESSVLQINADAPIRQFAGSSLAENVIQVHIHIGLQSFKVEFCDVGGRLRHEKRAARPSRNGHDSHAVVIEE